MGQEEHHIKEDPGVLGRCEKHGRFYALHYEELTDEMVLVHKVLL